MHGAAARAGLLRRIRGSVHVVDVVYAVKRLPPAGSAPTPTAPTAPLTGTRSVQTLIPGVVVPARATVPDVQCLWYEASALSDVASGRETRQAPVVGWREGATALACFWLDDVLEDSTKVFGTTLLTECDALDHFGERFHVQAQERIAGAGALPYALYVWVGSATGQ